MINSLILLAGGLATRLRPATLHIPKSLIDIDGKPFIHYQLELLKKQCISKVIICAGYLGEMIQQNIGNGDKFGLKIDYSFDGNELLGTGGAVKKALHLANDEFYIMYGDSYLNIDFKPINEYFNKLNKSGLMTVFKNDNRLDKSNIIFKNGSIIKYDKKSYTPEMKYIDYGLGVLTKKSFIDFADVNKFDLADVYMKLVNKNDIAGYEVFNRFYEIGSIQGLKETTEYLSRINNANNE
jgi:N-acetyl-alpha-D-muramate 1-phosphate uridylyltransferase